MPLPPVGDHVIAYLARKPCVCPSARQMVLHLHVGGCDEEILGELEDSLHASVDDLTMIQGAIRSFNTGRSHRLEQNGVYCFVATRQTIEYVWYDVATHLVFLEPPALSAVTAEHSTVPCTPKSHPMVFIALLHGTRVIEGTSGPIGILYRFIATA